MDKKGNPINHAKADLCNMEVRQIALDLFVGFSCHPTTGGYTYRVHDETVTVIEKGFAYTIITDDMDKLEEFCNKIMRLLNQESVLITRLGTSDFKMAS